MRKMDDIKFGLDAIVRAYALDHQVASKSYDEILNKYAQFFVENDVWDTEYFDSPSYYASKMEINGKDVWENYSGITEFIASTLWVSDWMFDCQSKRKIEILPEFLADNHIAYVVLPDATPEDMIVAKLKGEFVLLVPVETSPHGNDEIKPGFSDYGFGDERIMPASQWEQIEDDLHDWDSDLVMNEVSNHFFNTAGKIIDAVLKEIDDADFNNTFPNTPIIQLPGQVTEIYDRCKMMDGEEDYCIIIGERSGQWIERVLMIHGRIALVKSNDLYFIVYVGEDDAEPNHEGVKDWRIALEEFNELAEEEYA